jgi:nuclear GTP-binding protein
MPARKKFKIAKKVREHNRKVRKEAKKHKAKRLKKDPGIPNLFPLKEQLLKQLEEKKQQMQAAKEKERELRVQERKKKRSLQGLQNDAQRRTKEFEKKQALQTSVENEGVSAAGRRTLRAYHREFRQVLEMADVVLEVLDARDPLGTRCLEVEQSVMAAGSDKKLILVLNKIDLVPKANVEAWLKHLRNDFPTVAFKASTQTQKRNLSRRKGVNTAPPGVMTSSACLGAELLLKLLGNYCRNADIRTSITVGVVGLPNVGKSSIINSLKRSKACGVGATPGITKSLQEVQLDKHVKLIDSPGIVMATGSGDSASLVLRNCVKVEAVEDALPAVEAILRRCNHLHLLQHYSIPQFSDTQEFLAHLARRTGKLKKGGIPNLGAAARAVLQDWNTGRISYYTHPPEQHTLPTHISAELVQQWSEAFDLVSLSLSLSLLSTNPGCSRVDIE